MALLPLVAAVHGALEEHRYCSEHDAIEDVAEAGFESPAAPRDAESTSVEAPSTATSDHAVCPFAGETVRADGPALAPPPCAAAPRTDTAPPIAADRLVAPPVPLLSAAPKQSPPSPVA
jgi:hypothetical protein